jgi:hypothetical protein
LIESQTSTNWTPLLVALGVLLFLIGILTAGFAERILRWWIKLLTWMGKSMATRFKANPALWVPKFPTPKGLVTEIWTLRVTGILFAGLAVLIMYLIFTKIN